MKLIIDIPQKVNEHIRAQVGHGYYPFIDTDESHLVGKAILNGTPIPYNAKVCDKACFVSVGEKEPDEISEEVTLRFFRNTLKVRWQDLVIYNVEWLKKNWQMEMDIVCGVKPCDDVVSREAVLNEFYDVENLYNRIKQLPSVRPQEPKTGHWIKNAEEWDNINPPYICSECMNAETRQRKFCSECGARMVKQRESE